MKNHHLYVRQRSEHPLEVLYSFFSEATNLERITPAECFPARRG